MQQFSQKVQKCNVISLDIKLLKVTCWYHLIAHKLWKIHHWWFVSIATFTLKMPQVLSNINIIV